MKSRAATSFWLGGQLSHGAFEMLFDDLLSSAQTIERLDAKHIGAGGALFLPQPLHDELEIRRLDACAVFSALHRAEATESGLDLSGPTSSSTRSTSFGSMLTASPVSSA